MRYKITHTTSYAYSEPVRVCHNLVLLTPREDGNVRCKSHRLLIRPTPQASSRRKDFFGNQVHAFSIEENHRSLTVTASSRVNVDLVDYPPPEESTPWETIRDGLTTGTDPLWFEAAPFLFDSPRIHRRAAFAEYAAESFAPERPILEAVLDLTRRIHAEFAYDAKATTVSTGIEEAFLMKKGVCQDFAQIQIACLRSLGLAARYVSGYLRTIPPPGKPRLVGADQSHAWCSVYCGALGWVDVDPTNDAICKTDHVPLAWGRDYDDVTPIKGVFLGGGQHQLRVSVDVAPMESESGRD